MIGLRRRMSRMRRINMRGRMNRLRRRRKRRIKRRGRGRGRMIFSVSFVSRFVVVNFWRGLL